MMNYYNFGPNRIEPVDHGLSNATRAVTRYKVWRPACVTIRPNKQSEVVTWVEPGMTVIADVTKDRGRRVHLIHPVVGWCNTRSRRGTTFLVPIDNTVRRQYTSRQLLIMRECPECLEFTDDMDPTITQLSWLSLESKKNVITVTVDRRDPSMKRDDAASDTCSVTTERSRMNDAGDANSTCSSVSGMSCTVEIPSSISKRERMRTHSWRREGSRSPKGDGQAPVKEASPYVIPHHRPAGSRELPARPRVDKSGTGGSSNGSLSSSTTTGTFSTIDTVTSQSTDDGITSPALSQDVRLMSGGGDAEEEKLPPASNTEGGVPEHKSPMNSDPSELSLGGRTMSVVLSDATDLTMKSLDSLDLDDPPERTQPRQPAVDPNATFGFEVGDTVLVRPMRVGTIKFIGSTEFNTHGVWCGLELVGAYKGTHDGTLNGKTYFRCPKDKGFFTRMSNIVRRVILDGEEAEHNVLGMMCDKKIGCGLYKLPKDGRCNNMGEPWVCWQCRSRTKAREAATNPRKTGHSQHKNRRRGGFQNHQWNHQSRLHKSFVQVLNKAERIVPGRGAGDSAQSTQQILMLQDHINQQESELQNLRHVVNQMADHLSNRGTPPPSPRTMSPSIPPQDPSQSSVHPNQAPLGDQLQYAPSRNPNWMPKKRPRPSNRSNGRITPARLEAYVNDTDSNYCIRSINKFTIWFDFEVFKKHYNIADNRAEFCRQLANWEWKLGDRGCWTHAQLQLGIASSIADIVPPHQPAPHRQNFVKRPSQGHHFNPSVRLPKSDPSGYRGVFPYPGMQGDTPPSGAPNAPFEHYRPSPTHAFMMNHAARNYYGYGAPPPMSPSPCQSPTMLPHNMAPPMNAQELLFSQPPSVPSSPAPSIGDPVPPTPPPQHGNYHSMMPVLFSPLPESAQTPPPMPQLPGAGMGMRPGMHPLDMQKSLSGMMPPKRSGYDHHDMPPPRPPADPSTLPPYGHPLSTYPYIGAQQRLVSRG